MGLKGKTLFMTGGSRGIGLAIGLKAARDGANVAIAAKTAEPHKHLPPVDLKLLNMVYKLRCLWLAQLVSSIDTIGFMQQLL